MPQLPVKHYPQEMPSGCLAACSQMVLNYLGLNYSQTQLNRLFELTKAGVPFSRLKRLTQYGVQVNIMTGDLPDLYKSLNRNIPPIVFVRTGELHYWHSDTQHAVVITGYEGNFLLLNDPAFPQAPQRVSSAEFMLAWDEFDNHYVHFIQIQI